MAKIFGNQTTDNLEQTKDSLGGYSPFTSDIYIATLKAVYATVSKSGAQAVNIIADIDGREYRETIYITNREGKNYFLNKQDPTKKIPLPGFTTINDLCLIASEKPLCDQDFEEKVLNIYSFEAGKEEPTNVPVAVELIGKKVALGIMLEKHNKTAKVGDEYVPTEEIRESNTISKVFHPEFKCTVNEAQEGRDPVFWDKWLEANKGQVKDRTVKTDGKSGSPVSSKAAPTQAPKKSLFGKK
jgi:hypothetical protein